MYGVLHVYGVLLIGKMSCVIRCVLSREWPILLMLQWQDHITRTFLSVDIYWSMIFNEIKISPPHTYEHRYVKYLTTLKIASMIIAYQRQMTPANILFQPLDLKRHKSYNITTKKFRTL